MIRYTLALLVACADAPLTIDEYPCPPQGTQLSYESFGRAWLAEHCARCHDASEGHRSGAPEAYRFDTLAAVRAHRARIFARAAGPNTTMPPGPDDPSAESREQLAEWLACGAP